MMKHRVLASVALSVALLGCEGLGKMFHKPTLAERIEGLKSSRPAHVRRENVRWIMEHPQKVSKEQKKEVVELLSLLLLGDLDRLVRGYAAVALGRLQDDPDGIRALIEAMKRDKDTLVRCDAVKALLKYNDRAMIPEFARVARSDRDSEVRQSAVNAIGALGGKEAVPDLIDALRDRDASVVFTASERLTDLTGQKLGLNQQAWREWWSENREKPLGAKPARPKKKKDAKAEKPKADKKKEEKKKKKKKLFFF